MLYASKHCVKSLPHTSMQLMHFRKSREEGLITKEHIVTHTHLNLKYKSDLIEVIAKVS